VGSARTSGRVTKGGIGNANPEGIIKSDDATCLASAIGIVAASAASWVGEGVNTAVCKAYQLYPGNVGFRHKDGVAIIVGFGRAKAGAVNSFSIVVVIASCSRNGSVWHGVITKIQSTAFDAGRCNALNTGVGTNGVGSARASGRVSKGGVRNANPEGIIKSDDATCLASAIGIVAASAASWVGEGVNTAVCKAYQLYPGNVGSRNKDGVSIVVGFGRAKAGATNGCSIVDVLTSRSGHRSVWHGVIADI
jgi:organic hydroperoxide reductase OsmC/OhrA